MERQSDSFKFTQGVTGQTWKEVKRFAPRPATLESEVYVPVAQAGFIGLTAALAAGALAAASGGDAWTVGAVVGALATCGAAVFILDDSQRARWATETYEGEAHQHTATGAQAQQDTLKVQLFQDNGSGNTQIVNRYLNVSREQLARLVGVEALSVRSLIDCDFSQPEAQRLIQQMTEAGFIRRDAETKPAYWTPAGRAMMRRIVE